MSLKYRAVQNFSLPIGTLDRLRALARRTGVPQSRYVEEALEALLPKYGAAEILEQEKAKGAAPKVDLFDHHPPKSDA